MVRSGHHCLHSPSFVGIDIGEERKKTGKS